MILEDSGSHLTGFTLIFSPSKATSSPLIIQVIIKGAFIYFEMSIIK
ncbi:MAG: hypothetical protein A8274_276 [Halanaerobium sp. 4-GBenrich]|nr:MAG: hypothetical protein A8274_276 [Halanaerobium sp. 4-GBenrich]